MRARFALKYADILVALREVSLRNKPEALLTISPKGTVPVLQLPDGQIIDESIMIVQWALRQKGIDEPKRFSAEQNQKIQNLIELNDKVMVQVIHRFKYRERYPENEFHDNEKKLHQHFKVLDSLLENKSFFTSDHMTSADIALFPFVRQVEQINPDSFRALGFTNLTRWLDYFTDHPLFEHVMAKYPEWTPGDENFVF